MTRLFILLYLGVLAVLFAAWYIHGKVSQNRALADRSRVFEEAHGGGARLVANRLDSVPPENRNQVMESLRQRFDYPIDLVRRDRLPHSVQRRLSNGSDVVYYVPEGEREVVVAAIAGDIEVVRFGPFPSFGIRTIEESIGGWMGLVADTLESAASDERQAVLENLQRQFEFPIEVTTREDIPSSSRDRLDGGADVVFYVKEARAEEVGGFAVVQLPGTNKIVRCGPFPNFERNEQRAAATTLALVLLPVALAIALMLRPVALQLRHVERAAKAIASGDLSARVDDRRIGAAKPLAQAFNHMADQTETLVRTQRELLQAVSHELRTPLSRMRFAIELIETAKDDTQRRERLDSLDAATEELDQLVGELIGYVRMETTEIQLDRECVLIREALEVAIPKCEALFPSIDFRVNDSVSAEAISVFASRQSLQRVLGNLLNNAGRFAKAKVEISATSSDSMTIIDVDDDGCGIAESDRERVFEPFVRLESQRNTNERGTGLGLALVKRIVMGHEGRVEVLTSPRGGCRIRTTWPNNATVSETGEASPAEFG